MIIQNMMIMQNMKVIHTTVYIAYTRLAERAATFHIFYALHAAADQVLKITLEDHHHIQVPAASEVIRFGRNH